MRKDINFAGVAMMWTEEYAKSYCAKLEEMGFYAKVFVDMVAYSPLPFSRSEAIDVLSQKIKGASE